MQVTEVKFYKNTKKDSKVLAHCSVSFDNHFVVHRLMLVQGDKGLFIVFPQIELKNGQRKDICHPLDTETRKSINAAVIEAWNAQEEIGEDAEGIKSGESSEENN